MLTSVKIGNFKAFSEVQTIPLCPLTLIYGANSSGKSSILHSLLMAKNAQETGILDVFRTHVGGEAVDLGGFRQFVHQRDVSRRVELSFEFDTSGFTGRLAELLSPVKMIIVTLTFGMSLDDKGCPLKDSLPEIHSYEILSGEKSLMRMSKRGNGKLQLDRLNHEHPIFREVVKAIVETSTTTESIQLSDYEGLDNVITEIVPGIIAKSGKFLPEGLMKTVASDSGTQATLFPVSKGRRKEDLAAAVSFFIPRALDEIIRGISRAIYTELDCLHYLGPLRSYPPRHLAFAEYNDPNWYPGGGYAWDVVRRDSTIRAKVNSWLSAPELQTPYELIVRDLVGLDQLDEPLIHNLERISNEKMEFIQALDSESFYNENFPLIEDTELEAEKIRESIRTSDVEKLNELIMRDMRSNTIVSHRDVGIGVSQVLPVLVGAFASENKIVAIEQPEIHLHPALQAELGDVFIQSALGESRNRFIIETHSEHILLRIMKRMRETYNSDLPEGFPEITPHDVCVLFVKPEGASSTVRHMELDVEGQLLSPWPGGFFEEGFRERFG